MRRPNLAADMKKQKRKTKTKNLSVWVSKPQREVNCVRNCNERNACLLEMVSRSRKTKVPF